MIAQRPEERSKRPRHVDLLRRSCTPPGEREKVVGDLPAVRTIAPDATIRPYYLASIATIAESNNVANSGDSMARAARSTQDLPRPWDLHGQVSRAVWPPGGEWVRPAPALIDARSALACAPSNHDHARHGILGLA